MRKHAISIAERSIAILELRFSLSPPCFSSPAFIPPPLSSLTILPLFQYPLHFVLTLGQFFTSLHFVWFVFSHKGTNLALIGSLTLDYSFSKFLFSDRRRWSVCSRRQWCSLSLFSQALLAISLALYIFIDSLLRSLTRVRERNRRTFLLFFLSALSFFLCWSNRTFDTKAHCQQLHWHRMHFVTVSHKQILEDLDSHYGFATSWWTLSYFDINRDKLSIN